MGDSDERTSPLATVLQQWLGAGGLEPALHAVRQLQADEPGHRVAPEVLEALEFLCAYVQRETVAARDPFDDGARLLAAGDFEAAVARYGAACAARADERSTAVLDRLCLLAAALAGRPLPERGALPVSTRVEHAASGFRLLDLSSTTDETMPGTISAPSSGSSPRTASPFDDVTAIDMPIRFESDSSEDTTQLALDPLGRVQVVDPDESTRVAKPGEIPIEELRRQIGAEGGRADRVESVPVKIFSPPPAPLPEAGSAGPAAVRSLARGLASKTGLERPLAPSAPSEVVPTEAVHTPLTEREAASSFQGGWREPGLESAPAGESLVSPGGPSWPGLSAYSEEPAVFDPKVADVASDQWADEVPADGGPDATPAPMTPTGEPVREAELLVTNGELGAALGAYQDLAALTPEDERLWDRIEEIARMLQLRSRPPGPPDE